MADSCERVIEPSISINGKEFLQYQRLLVCQEEIIQGSSLLKKKDMTKII